MFVIFGMSFNNSFYFVYICGYTGMLAAVSAYLESNSKERT